MEKYGFVYVWYDIKKKMFYVGSHWGTEDDGYICSSDRMRKSYRRRPDDFKRRIISRVWSSKKDLLDLEYSFLSLIKEEELGQKYYNLTKHRNGHWFEYPESLKKTSERIRYKTKEAMQRKEVREKMDRYYDSIRGKKQSEELIEKRRKSMKETMAKKFPIETRKGHESPKFNSAEYKQNMSESVSKSWENRDKEKIGKKISRSLKASKEQRSKHISQLKWWNNGQVNRRSAERPGIDFIPGVLKKIT